jgi:hypothetical protein
VEKLLIWCHANEILIHAAHIKSSLNVMADKLSRQEQIVQTEWSIHPSILPLIWTRFYVPDLDLFATRFNTVLDKFVSPFPDEKALAIDAMSLDWTGLNAFAFPSTAMLRAVLLKLTNSPRCRVILIAPEWQKQDWYPTLQKLKVGSPMALPEVEFLLK